MYSHARQKILSSSNNPKSHITEESSLLSPGHAHSERIWELEESQRARRRGKQIHQQLGRWPKARGLQA